MIKGAALLHCRERKKAKNSFSSTQRERAIEEAEDVTTMMMMIASATTAMMLFQFHNITSSLVEVVATASVRGERGARARLHAGRAGRRAHETLIDSLFLVKW
jgi:hypothetical protein